MTYLLIVAMERDRDLSTVLEEFCALEAMSLDPALARRVARAIASSRAVDDCVATATRLCGRGRHGPPRRAAQGGRATRSKQLVPRRCRARRRWR